MENDDSTRMVEQILNAVAGCKGIPDDTSPLRVAGALIVAGLLLSKEQNMKPTETIAKLMSFIEAVYSVEIAAINEAIIFYSAPQEVCH